MRRLFIIFLLLFHSFFFCANAQNINFPVKNFDTHFEYISAQTNPQRKISIDFKNYENALIISNSKTQEIFTKRNSNNIDGYVIGFWNCNFKNVLGQNLLQTTNYNEYNAVHYLKNLIYTRAP